MRAGSPKGLIKGMTPKEYMRGYMRDWRVKHPDRNKDYRQSHPREHIITQLRYRARKLSVPFDLVADDVVIPAVCPVFGSPMRLFVGDAKTRPDDAVSIDRIVPEKGYVRGNVQAISQRANRLKNNATLDELRAIVRYMENNR